MIGPISRLAVPGRPAPLLVGRLPGCDDPSALEAEIDALVEQGVHRVVCLVPTADLEEVWDLPGYVPAARARFGGLFLHVPVQDCATPRPDRPFEVAVAEVDRGLKRGETAFVHCVAGCGRTGTFSACVLVRAGLPPAEAIRAFEAVRGCGPESRRQAEYVGRYAQRLAKGLVAR